MHLSNLQPNPAYTKKRKRVGRGPGSGHGKTSCRGHKGSKQRSGGNVGPLYEGGQMPLHRRLPKRGFTNIFKKHYAIVNLKDLERFDANTVVDLELLLHQNVLKKPYDGLRVLGLGELTKPLTVKADHVSKSAGEKIKHAGGKVEVAG